MRKEWLIFSSRGLLLKHTSIGLMDFTIYKKLPKRTIINSKNAAIACFE
jgi:hypothetical protein